MEDTFASITDQEIYAQISAQEPDTDMATADEEDCFSQLAARRDVDDDNLNPLPPTTQTETASNNAATTHPVAALEKPEKTVMDTLDSVFFQDYYGKKDQGIVEDAVDYFSLLVSKVPSTEHPWARAEYISKLKMFVKTAHFISRYDADEIERQLDTLLPFAERNGYRKKHMYRGWQLETVEELHALGECTFTTTRSNFGYRVLNSPDLGAVDVDFDLGPGIVETHIAAQQKEALSNIRDWVAAHPQQSWRVYRTAGGLRMIRTDAPQPLDETYVAVGKAIEQSDRLYCKLCKEQMAFRLRISPKVARIGADYPGWSPYAYPEGFWDHAPTPEDILAYDMLAGQYKVAELIEVFGSGQVHPALVAVLRYHDDNCRVDSSLPMERPAASEYVVFASIPELIAFNDVYRPNGIAPDQIWENLDPEVRRALRALDGDSYHDNAEEDTVVIGCSRRELLLQNCRYLDRLFEKWNGAENYKTFDVLYAAAFEEYTEGAKQFKWTPSPNETIHGWKTGGHWESSEDLVGGLPDDDPRYWRLAVNDATAETPNGSAIIRFLPSSDNQRWVKQKTLGFVTHNLCNILVVKDPRHPENEGKVLLFRFGARVLEKLQDVIAPPPEFPDMVPIDPFDWMTGCNFKIRAVQFENELNLDRSTFDDPTPVGDDNVIADLRTKVHPLDGSLS